MKRAPIKKKPRKNLEGRLQLAIIKMVRSLGYAIGKTKTVGIFRDGRFSKDRYVFLGFPDLTMFVPELVFCEVKSEKGLMSPDQIEFAKLCTKAGIRYIVARKIEDVVEVINKTNRRDP